MEQKMNYTSDLYGICTSSLYWEYIELNSISDFHYQEWSKMIVMAVHEFYFRVDNVLIIILHVILQT